MNEASVLSVSQLNRYIKSLIEGDENLRMVFVVGEISNFTNHRSGHFYMTIKDETAAVRAVMFSSSNRHLRFMPENGMNVIIRGRVSVFERDGQYQLYIDDMQTDGLGALNAAYEQLKKKLEAEGLFAQEKKRAIPKYPQRIGVVTSPTGAAVRDIFNVLSRRFPACTAVICPVEVQGERAASQIAGAIKLFNERKAADVLIVGRGGGSIEDLWAFNEEIVVRAVAQSGIPVISAVGHETDFTICDFASDLRAPTPSAAAELAVPDFAEQQDYINSLKYTCLYNLKTRMNESRSVLKNVDSRMMLLTPSMQIFNSRQNLDRLFSDAAVNVKNLLASKRSGFAELCARADALSPLKILSRGYCVTYKNGTILKTTQEVELGDFVDIRLSDAVLKCEVVGKEKNNGRIENV